jgi:opacity protein-like surface antigen
VRGGLAFLITKNIAAFAEYRFTRVKPEFGFDVTFKTETTLDTHPFLAGVGFRF